MPLKILHCIHSLYGGGAERQLTILANHVDGNDMVFSILCVDDSINEIDNRHCQVLNLSNENNYPWHMIKEVCIAINDFKPDIVHCWLPPSVSTPALIAAKLKGVPAVASYRNKKIFESWIRGPEFISNLLCADSIVANNPPEQSSYLFRKLFDMKSGVVIPNAVSVDSKFKNKKQESKTNEIFTLLFVGRLTHQKNWQVLLNSLAKIGSEKQWQLLVCGKGEDEADFIRLCKGLGLEDKVTMLGYREDIYSIMAESNLLILPSWYEGMPNVVLEGLSLGLPAVISSILAHTCLFGSDSGVEFFDPTSAEQLASILNSILNGEIDISELAKEGLVFVEKYTPLKLLVRYNAYYLDVIKLKKVV